jgi:hypothetical protein
MAATSRKPQGTWEFDYTPRKELVDFHKRPNRFAFLICHRRYEPGSDLAQLARSSLRAVRRPEFHPMHSVRGQEHSPVGAIKRIQRIRA